VTIQNARLYSDLQSTMEQLRVTQSSLLQAQKLESVGQLAAGIAHEINTPIQFIGDNVNFLGGAFEDLNSVRAAAEALAAASLEGDARSAVERFHQALEDADIEFLVEEIPAAVDQTLDGVKRVASIVQALKDFSHPGSDEKEPLDINHALENTLTVARNEWKYHAEAVTDLDPALPPVPALSGPLHQVFLNLVVNAAHAVADQVGDGGEKGTITVSTRLDGGWAEVRISDTGTGIPAEIRERVFDPFFTTKEIGKGTGQGLSIAHTVVAARHGGELSFETTPGEGTTFIVRLPLEARGEPESGEGR
jgi:signal transduction histidine kinase